MTPKDYRKTTGKPRQAVQKRAKCDAIKPNKQKCGLPAGYGTDHPGKGPCKHHFGNTARVVRGAALDDAKDVARVLTGMGVTADMDPGEVLRWEVNNTLGHVAWHRAVIDTWQLLNKDGSANPLSPDQAEFYERYLAEREHLIKAARMAIAADVEGRAMRLAEQEAAQLADAVEQILNLLRLTAAQRELIPDVVPGVLREIGKARPLVLDGVFSTDDTLNEAIAASRRAKEK